eukprot:TRINITY_DN17076_c0_g1_i1.p1 TRINITY_DN17076_c0_g1~~TRINITY_DN17076_c0_g1_i1.p1  ORF type:complete len:252 (-),score=18.06 TRINITY_DN17076_c0_g1_i1:53-808(-)
MSALSRARSLPALEGFSSTCPTGCRLTPGPSGARAASELSLGGGGLARKVTSSIASAARGPVPASSKLSMVQQSNLHSELVYEAQRPGSAASSLAPPSTAGPSASVVAAQTQQCCRGCGKPMPFEASFCSACGRSLHGSGGGAVEQARQRSLAQAPSLHQLGDGRRLPLPLFPELGRRGLVRDPNRGPAPEPALALCSAVEEKAAAAVRFRPRPGQRRPRRSKSEAHVSSAAWARRERDVHVWLGNIQPRR